MIDSSLINPKITTLIPTYQRPTLLKRAIKSALSQTYKNLQVVVFDNASGDDTAKMVSDLALVDNRLKYICHSNNIGVLANFKYSFQSIETEYFSLLCDDDFLTKNCYEEAIKILDNNADIDFVILDTLFVDSKLNLKVINPSKGGSRFFNDLNRFDRFHSGDVPITLTGIVFRRKLAEIYLEMDFRFDLGSDIRFTYHAAARYNYAYVAKVGSIVMLHDQEISANRPIFSHADIVIQMERYVEIIYDEKIPIHIKNRAKYFLRKMNNKNIEWTFLKLTLKSLFRNYLEFSEVHDKIINSYISYLKETDNQNISKLIVLIKNNILIKILLFPLSTIFKRIQVKRRRSYLHILKLLQEGVYKELFDDIRQIANS